MTCIAAQHPIWQYFAVSLSFLALTCGMGWVVKDQWDQRQEPSWRAWHRVTAFAARFERTWMWACGARALAWAPGLALGVARRWGVVAHRVTLWSAVVFGVFTLWLSGAVLVNAILYAHDLLSGMPRCG